MTQRVRILTEADLRRCVRADDTSLAAIESAFAWIDQGRVSMPPIMHIEAKDRNGDVDVKSAYVSGVPRFAVKIASGFYDNPSRGLPAGSAMMVVLSAETGFCEAVLLDNGYLTDLRTGLAGAVAAKHLAPRHVHTVGVVGTGLQARYQLECLRLVRGFERVLVWGRSAEKLAAYVSEMRERLGVDVRAVDSVAALVRESQIVVTTTASRSPLVQTADLHPGLHITAVGSDFPGKQELDADVLRRADLVVCDRVSQCRANGELQHVLEDGRVPEGLPLVELGQVVTGVRQGRANEDVVTVCDLTGTGVQDTAIADLAVTAAIAAGLGTFV